MAKPVQIQPLVNGTPKGSPQTVSASPVSVSVPLETGLNRITFRLTDAAGNTSEVSDPVNVTRDSSSTSTNTIVTFDAPFTMPIPVASSYQIGGGSYKLKMIFSKDMDGTANPMINITTAGGVKITSSAGTWTASNTYIGDFNVPSNGGSSYDGAATLSITGAKDTFGNTLDPISVPSGGGSAFFIDLDSGSCHFSMKPPPSMYRAQPRMFRFPVRSATTVQASATSILCSSHSTGAQLPRSLFR